MRCENCRRSEFPGYVLVATRQARGGAVNCWAPCPSCDGSSQQSCCEGMVGCARDVTNGAPARED